MALRTPVDREFAVLPAGHIRDRVVLANFREGLRSLTNPETGQPFTFDEIQRATQPRSRWYVGAQGIDDYGQGEQRKAIWLADQIRLERASTKWLIDYHARLWGEQLLDATGGSGEVSVSGVPGTIVASSTTLGDPSAYTARDAAGNLYQVTSGGVVGPGGSSPVGMQAVSVGSNTNPLAGTLLTWVSRDPNMAPQATIATDFRGGTDRETDAELAARIAGIVRHRPGGGNDSHVRAWARASSNAVADGLVYPCAFFAGSTLVSILQKRTAGSTGPTGRQPSSGTLANAIAYLTPPLSPVHSQGGFVVVTGWTAQYTDLGFRLGLPRASAAGFRDQRPFPSYHATTPRVVSRVSDTDFTITCPGDAALPPGSSVPSLMLWDLGRSAFVALSVAEVQDLGGSLFRVVLSSPPDGGVGVEVGQRVSPALAQARANIVAQAIRDYFDSLGPGELFDLDADSRGGRCVRFVPATEELPYRAGSLVATRVIEALGGTSADGELASISQTVPTYPTNLMLGPNMLVCGHVGLYGI
jgi:Baseplate J-like protein